MKERFGTFRNINSLWEFYYKSLEEFYRILKKGGTLVFKCQDTVDSGKNRLSHVYIINSAENIGFYTKDLYILLAKSRLIRSGMKSQIHARKFHSYFLVFEKR